MDCTAERLVAGATPGLPTDLSPGLAGGRPLLYLLPNFVLEQSAEGFDGRGDGELAGCRARDPLVRKIQDADKRGAIQSHLLNNGDYSPPNFKAPEKLGIYR